MLIFQDLEASTQSARIRTGVNEIMSRFGLPSAGLAPRVTPVRGWKGDKRGYALGVRDRRQDLIRPVMERMKKWKVAVIHGYRYFP